MEMAFWRERAPHFVSPFVRCALNTHDKLLLKLLFSVGDKWADLYLLHERYLLSPGQISNAVRRACDAGIIETDCNLNARLTAGGRAWVLLNRKAIFLSGKRWWATPSVEPNSTLEDTYAPRLPSLSKIDKAFFEKLNG